MTIDITQPQTPGWWLHRLLTRLGEQQSRYQLLHDYYRGDPPLPWGPENCRPAFRQFQRKARTNFAALIVDAVVERMRPVGFRTGAVDDLTGDAEAWRYFQANGLDIESTLLFRTAAVMSEAYLIVGWPDPTTGVPLITAEDPRQVITERDPRNRRRTIAAIKTYTDDLTANDMVHLYLPGVVYKAKRTRSAASGSFQFDASGWEWVDTGSPLPAGGAGLVPVYRYANRVDLTGEALGEFEDVTDDIDRINLMLLQRLTVAVMQAFRQRAVKGDLPETDIDGEPVDYDDLFRSDPGALWRLPAGVEMWESAGVDLTPLLESVKADIRDLAGSTRTPMFYMFPDAANGSAEGASLQREGLFFKAQDRINAASDPMQQAMATAFLFAGDRERARRLDMQVLWQPPDRVSMAERYDAASKAAAAGVTWRARMRDVLGFTPQQIAEMEAERAAEAFLQPAATDVRPSD